MTRHPACNSHCYRGLRARSFPRAVRTAIDNEAPEVPQCEPRNPVTAVEPQNDGPIFTMKTGTLRLQVCSDSIIHVLYSPTSSFPPSRPDPVVIKTSWPASKIDMQTNE